MPEVTESAATAADGRARLKRALFKPGTGQWVVGVLMALVGLAAVVVMRTNSESDPYDNMRQEQLINVMEGLTGTTDRARREIADLEETRRKLLEDATAEDAALTQAKARATTLDILAGRVGVQGSGVRIDIVPTRTDTIYVPMIDMIQELRTAGAEAIAINGRVRVVAQTAFGTLDGQLSVDGQVLRAPYTVVAIGSSGELGSALTFRQGPKAQFEAQGASLEFTELEQVEIAVTVPVDDAATEPDTANQ